MAPAMARTETALPADTADDSSVSMVSTSVIDGIDIQKGHILPLILGVVYAVFSNIEE